MNTFTAIPELAATASHIVAVQATLNRLARVKDESWAQVLTAAARLYRDDGLSATDLLHLAQEMRDGYGGGYRRLWDENMPVTLAALPHVVARESRDRPNGENGSWHGVFPLYHQSTPPHGVSVVYVLFDDSNAPVYVGSTYVFRTRMGQHRRDKRDSMRSWVAYPCRDRDHAYELERDLLRRYKLRLNYPRAAS